MVRLESRLAALAALALAAASPAAAQIVGENVNMVSGTQWPGGDPFLQRQNEPTLAVSSINPQHLLAAANDYRSVDLPNPNIGLKVNGDAWLGIFKSLDGGQTWRSVLLPGYPQDRGCTSPAPPAPVGHVHTHRCGHTEPAPAQGGQFALCGMPASADPVVRAGTDGMFYVGGINFQRDKSRSRLFLARYVDANNKENGDATKDSDAIRYVDTRIIAEAPAGTFIDKPWFAVDVPRAGAATCEIPLSDDPGGPKRTFLGGIIYAAWAEFVEPAETSSELKFTWSKDCGRTWVTPYRLNSANSVLNQGVSLAIEPNSGRVYAAWRRFPSGKQGDAILVTRSEGRSKHFSAPRVISASMTPFEQFMDGATFRAEAFPAMAISTDGTRSWLHVGWSQKKASGDGRIYLSSAQVYPPPNGDQDLDEDEALDAETRLQWSTPAAVDDAPIADDAGHAFSRGHQAMPSLTFSQGRLVLVYYDTRLDHTRRYYRPRVPFAPSNGHFYEELLAPLGELVGAGPGGVFAPTITDAGLTQVRRTLDVRVAVAGPGPTQAWKSVQANRFSFGLRGDEFSNGGQGLTVDSFDGAAAPLSVVDATGKVQLLQQLQHNPPNLPIFKNGTRPFMGDYIDIQGPAFATTPAGGWVHNTAPTAAPVFHAVWTSNQDVKAPPVVNGQPDWTGYTPIGGGGASVYDPLVTTPACNAAYAGTRDQNIYTARITEGLAVSSPQNQKALSPAETRTFVVAAQNTTPDPMTVDLVATPGDSPGLADFSFVNDLSPGGVRTTALRGVVIPANSTVVRTLFARADSPSASIKAVATEACAVAPCRSGFVTLNPPVALAALLQPDGKGAPLSAGEQYAIQIMAPNVTNPNVTNPNVTNPNVTNPNVTNPNVTNPNVTNPNVTNPNVTNAAVSDLSYTVANTGNTTTSYSIQLVKFEDGYQAPSPVQLIISRTYYTPAADGCALKEVPHDQILVNVPDVSQALVSSKSVVDPNVTNPNVTNATLALPPGETAVITLRAFVTLPQMAALGAKLGPAAIPQSYRPQPGVTYENIASVLPGAGVVVPGAASRTQLTFDRATGLASVQVRPATGAGPTPTGQVYLIVNDAWRVAAFTLDASGNGSATIAPALPVGASLVAYYAGDSAYAGSLSGALQVARTGTLPSTLFINYEILTSRAGGRLYASSGGPLPTGTVTFSAGSVQVASLDLAAFTPDPGSVYFQTVVARLYGGDQLTAAYSGDASYAPATVTIPVSKGYMGGPAVAYSPVSGRVSVDLPVAQGLLPTGSMTLTVDGADVGSVDLATGTSNVNVQISYSGGGQGSMWLHLVFDLGRRLPAGSVILATFSGDRAYVDSTSAPWAVTLWSSTTSLAYDVLTSVADLRVDAVGFWTPSGTVTVLADGVPVATADLASGTPLANSVFLSLPITRPRQGAWLSASYGGDGVLYGSSSAGLLVRGAPVNLSVTGVDTILNVLRGQVTWPAGGPAPTGTVSFSVNNDFVGSATVDNVVSVVASSNLIEGETVNMFYGGDQVYAPASTSLCCVARAPTVTSITASDVFAGSVQVKVQGPATTGPLPLGWLYLQRGGVQSGVGFLDATGSASISVSGLARGQVLQVHYDGNGGYAPSDSAPFLVPGVATTATATYDPATAGVGVLVTPAAAGLPAAPTGAADLYADGLVVGSITLTTGGPGGASAGTGSLVGPPPSVGKQLQVHYVGDQHFEEAVSASQLMTGFALATPMPTARYYHASVALGSTIYLVGGRNDSGSVLALEAYDTVAGTWSTRAPLPAAIDFAFGTPAAALGGKILAFRSGQPTLIYDPASNAWTTGATGPTFTLTTPAVSAGGRIYLVSQSGAVSACDATGACLQVATLPDARGQFALAEAGGKVYVIGGVAPHNIVGNPWGLYFDTILVFDPASAAFTTFPARLLHPVHLDSAAEVSGRLCVIGPTALSTVPATPQVIDPVAGTVTYDPVGWGGLRYATSSATVGGVLFLTGGRDRSAGSVESTAVDAYVPAP